MTSEKQIEANRNNAKMSTGPKDTSKTRFNAVRTGLTGECTYSKEEEEIIEKIYQELIKEFDVARYVDKLLVARLAKIYWRLQRVSQVEQAYFKNEKIKKRNHERTAFSSMLQTTYLETPEEEVESEIINTALDLINRYETNLENRFLKILSYLDKHR